MVKLNEYKIVKFVITIGGALTQNKRCTIAQNMYKNQNKVSIWLSFDDSSGAYKW